MNYGSLQGTASLQLRMSRGGRRRHFPGTAAFFWGELLLFFAVSLCDSSFSCCSLQHLRPKSLGWEVPLGPTMAWFPGLGTSPHFVSSCGSLYSRHLGHTREHGWVIPTSQALRCCAVKKVLRSEPRSPCFGSSSLQILFLLGFSSLLGCWEDKSTRRVFA